MLTVLYEKLSPAGKDAIFKDICQNENRKGLMNERLCLFMAIREKHLNVYVS